MRSQVDVISSTQLIAEVGEAIARQYLQGFKPVTILGGNERKEVLISSSWVMHPGALERTDKLNTEQKDYLFQTPGWDYVTFTKNKPCVVEVKTTKCGGRYTRKLSSQHIARAKTLGFKPTLLEVRLLDNWKAEIVESEL
jgi:hypothetical protein